MFTSVPSPARAERRALPKKALKNFISRGDKLGVGTLQQTMALPRPNYRPRLELPPLTPEQRRISDDFMKYWHEVLPRKYGIIDDFNHNYAVKRAPAEFQSTLEIGAGLGEHLAYEKLTPEQEQNYVALELRENMAAEIRRRFPRVQVRVGDCQERLEFPDASFDRILAIHVLEHLPDLSGAVREMHRLCQPDHGVVSIVIPCEGSLAYTFARRISAQRIFEKRYGQSYDWFIKREHLNRPAEILAELDPFFTISSRSFFPLPIPLLFCNLCLGLTLVPRRLPASEQLAAAA